MIVFIWILAALLLICFAVITSLLSMKDYLEYPDDKHGYSLYLIRNPGALTMEFFNKLHSSTKNADEIIAFEKLAKGDREALVVYLPKNFKTHFAQIDFLELLDYTDQINDSFVTTWEVIKSKKEQNPIQEMKILSGLNLTDEEQVYFQVVVQGGKETDFKVTMRAAVYAKESSRRLELAKILEKQLQLFGLERKKQRQNSRQIFNFYKKRSAYPQEINGLRLSGSRLKFLLN